MRKVKKIAAVDKKGNFLSLILNIIQIQNLKKFKEKKLILKFKPKMD